MACLIYFERVDRKVDMAARRQVANKLRSPYGKASKADKSKILDRVVATTGMGRSTARRMLTGPRLADPAERVDGRRLRPQRFSDDARALLEHVWALLGMPCGKYLVSSPTYGISILQAEFSLTQMLDKPVWGRMFFEQIIRDNLDIGRPDQVALVFDRRLMRRGPRRTPALFRTRVITSGVTPSLHVDYKHTRIKQYQHQSESRRGRKV